MQKEADVPHSLEAERAILGIVALSPTSWSDVAAALGPADFFVPANRRMFESMAALVDRGVVCEPIAIGDDLRVRFGGSVLDRGQEHCPEAFALAVANEAPGRDLLEHFVQIVREKSNLRRLIEICGDTEVKAHAGESADDLIEQIWSAVMPIAMGAPAGRVAASEMAIPLLEEFERRAREGAAKAVTGVCTGLTGLDQLTCGFQAGQVVVVAARPGNGKTALAMQAALNLVTKEAGAALVFNLEMTARELIERAFSHLARVNSQRLKRGDIEYSDFKKLQAAAGKLYDTGLYVADEAYSLRSIEAVARSWRVKNPTKKGLIVVDYLQLIQGANTRDSRSREIGIVAMGIKRLAKELKLPAILVSQLNRDPAKQDRAPTMADLRESGDIEQAADIIVLLHNPTSTEDGEIEVIVDKHRNGSCRRFKVDWRGRYYSFEDQEYAPPPAPPTDNQERKDLQ